VSNRPGDDGDADPRSTCSGGDESLDVARDHEPVEGLVEWPVEPCGGSLISGHGGGVIGYYKKEGGGNYYPPLQLIGYGGYRSTS